MRPYLAILTPARAGFPADASEAELAVVRAHFAHLQALLGAGRLLLAGRDETPAPTGYAVFEADDDAAAERVFREDPAVAEGIFVGRVVPFRVALMRDVPPE